MYRSYLDLRRQALQRNLRVRQAVAMAARLALVDDNFLEVLAHLWAPAFHLLQICADVNTNGFCFDASMHRWKRLRCLKAHQRLGLLFIKLSSTSPLLDNRCFYPSAAGCSRVSGPISPQGLLLCPTAESPTVRIRYFSRHSGC